MENLSTARGMFVKDAGGPGEVRMFGIIGTIDASAVIHGGGLRHGMMADENGVACEAEPVVWDNAEATPEFNVIGYAADRPQAVEVAHWFADSCGLLFIELGDSHLDGR